MNLDAEMTTCARFDEQNNATTSNGQGRAVQTTRSANPRGITQAMRPADTSPEAWRKFIELQRALPPGEKLRLAIERSETVRAFAEAGMRQRYPHAGAREIFLRLARMRLGRELFRKVYGDELQEDGIAHPGT